MEPTVAKGPSTGFHSIYNLPKLPKMPSNTLACASVSFISSAVLFTYITEGNVVRGCINGMFAFTMSVIYSLARKAFEDKVAVLIAYAAASIAMAVVGWRHLIIPHLIVDGCAKFAESVWTPPMDSSRPFI